MLLVFPRYLSIFFFNTPDTMHGSFLCLVVVFSLTLARSQFSGVNLAGLDFGGGHYPGVYGKDYTSPTTQEVDYYLGITILFTHDQKKVKSSTPSVFRFSGNGFNQLQTDHLINNILDTSTTSSNTQHPEEHTFFSIHTITLDTMDK